MFSQLHGLYGYNQDAESVAYSRTSWTASMNYCLDRSSSRRREDRGAEGAEGVGFGEGAKGHCPLPRKFFDFESENDDF